MRVLFTSEAVVEICNNKYHKTSFNPFIKRYQYFGDVIFASYNKVVTESGQSLLNTNGIDFEFFKKENSLIGRLKGHSINDIHMMECVKKADIIVVHLPSPIGMLAIKYAKLFKKTYFIGVVGCAWDAYWNYNWKGKLIALPTFLSMRKAISQSKYTFYVTQTFLQNRYPCKGLTIGCSNVEIENTTDEILQNRIDSIKSKSQDSILNIATVAAVNVRYKGQEYVIKSMAKLRDKGSLKFHYYLIGGGDNSFLKGLVDNLHLQEYAHFVGPIPHEKILARLDSMDLYIQPSRQEGLPRALIEAMSRALPAFGSMTAGIPELLPTECLFKNGDVTKISALLESLSMDKMIEYATLNFKKSQEYTTDVLTERRTKFFDKILTDIKSK